MQKKITLNLWDWLRIVLDSILKGFDTLDFNSKFDYGQTETPTVEALAVTVTTTERKTEHSSFEVLRPKAPLIIYVTPEERKEITLVAKHLKETYGKFDNNLFIAMLHIHAHKMLPERIVKILSDLASDFSYYQFGAIVFRGSVEVDQQLLGSTPETWRETDFEKIQLFGFVSALMHGAVRAVPIQQFYQRQGGGFIHSVIPNTQMADTQTGEGFKTVLYVHTEDACLNSAADYLSFLYLRNEEGAPSMLHSVRSHDLCKPYVDTLFKPIFKCPLDGNYSGSDKTGADKAAPVLTDNTTLPFMRFDPAEQLSDAANQTPEALIALKAFWADAEKLIYKEFIPSSGDMVFVNNKMVSHGRSPFEAGFKTVDGKKVPCEKRWMLRMMSTANLMKFYKYSHPENPYLGWEKQYDELFPNQNNK